MSDTLLAPVRATFRAVAETVVPEATSLGPDKWREVELVVESALATRPEATRRQLVAFLRLIEYLPLARHLRRFSRLEPRQRHDVLLQLERSRRLLFRRGLWGLRTLVFMGYYSRADVQAELGYRAHADGWQARRAARADTANGGGLADDDGPAERA